VPERFTKFGNPHADIDATPGSLHKLLELAAKDEFDVVVVNEQLEFACSELVSLLMGHTPDPA